MESGRRARERTRRSIKKVEISKFYNQEAGRWLSVNTFSLGTSNF